jgi:hypothetical protein
MRTTLAIAGVMTLLSAAVGARPAAAFPISNLASNQANASRSDIVPVQWRRHYGYWGPRRYWGPRAYYGAYGAPYAYGHYPYYRRYYAPGPYVHLGPRNFSFGFGWW